MEPKPRIPSTTMNPAPFPPSSAAAGAFPRCRSPQLQVVSSDRGAGTTDRGIRVLVIDSDPAFAITLKESLAALTVARINLDQSVTLNSAIQRLLMHRYDAILVNLFLPETRGLTTFARIQELASSLPIVAITSTDQEWLGREAVQQGAQDYLVRSKVDGKIFSRVIRYAIEKKRVERRLAAQHAVTAVLAGAGTLTEATAKILETVAASLEWDAGILWKSDPARGSLCFFSLGHPSRGIMADFDSLRGHSYKKGVGLPGRVWAVGYPICVQNPQRDARFFRNVAGDHEWFRGGFGFPVRIGTQVVGVMQFLSRQQTEVDSGILRMMEVIGSQVGQFMVRKEAEAALAEERNKLWEANQTLLQTNHDRARSEEALRQALVDLQASHTQLKATQLQLIQSGKMESVGTLAAGVAHEVKNPLQTILMGLAYLSRNLPAGDETISMVLGDMTDAVKRADGIVRDLLYLSAPNQLEIRSQDLNSVVERSLALVNYELTRARINLRREFSPELPMVMLDRARMEQVFINLFMNAIQAMPDSGCLTVRTRLPGPATGGGSDISAEQMVTIEIEDTGLGIPPEKLPRIFEPFFTTKPNGVGTGLGLPITRQIVELHGGKIEIKSSVGRGTLITLKLRIGNGE